MYFNGVAEQMLKRVFSLRVHGLTQLFFFFFLSSASLPRLPMLEWLAALLMLDMLSDECCRLIRRSESDGKKWLCSKLDASESSVANTGLSYLKELEKKQKKNLLRFGFAQHVSQKHFYIKNLYIVFFAS